MPPLQMQVASENVHEVCWFCVLEEKISLNVSKYREEMECKYK